MKVRILKCDGCNKILDENPESGPLDGFTEPSIERKGRGEWPDSLYHLCGYCVFWAKVAFIEHKQEINRNRDNASDAGITPS